MEDILVFEENVIEEGVTDESGREDNISVDSNTGISENFVKIDELVREESINEREQIDKSDGVILSGDDINNLRSIKAISISDIDKIFDTVLLYSDDSYSAYPNGSVNFNLNGNISDYDYILITFRGLNRSGMEEKSMIVSSEDFLNNPSTTRTGFYIGYTTTSPGYASRYIQGTDNQIKSYSAQGQTGQITKVYGLNIKENILNPSAPDIPINPSVSGNVVNNYYISLSGNGVSYNLIDKPLNEYTPTESMFALSVLFALGLGFVILMRKVVFRWH